MSSINPSKYGMNNMGALIRAMLASVRDYWTQAELYQKFAYSSAALLVASGVFHTGVFLLMDGSLEGPVSWRKPIAFSFSFGVTILSLAWVMTFLPKHKIRGWLLMGVFSVVSCVEVFLIAMQQWRGVPSHFNINTPFDTAVFNLTGVLVVFIALIIVVLTVWTFFSLKTSPSMAWAIRTGMVLLVAGQVFGYLIISNAATQLIQQTGRPLNIFGAAGVMKAPHAVSLHALQVLLVLAWLLQFTNRSETRRSQITVVASACYVGLSAVSAFQTFSGLAPFDMNLLVALVLGISVAGLAATYLLTLLTLLRPTQQKAA